MLPPQSVRVPAEWQNEIRSLAAHRSPSIDSELGFACPSQRIVLLIMKVSVVELVVISCIALVPAVAFCDIEHVTPVVWLRHIRWPRGGLPVGLSRGMQKQEQRGKNGED